MVFDLREEWVCWSACLKEVRAPTDGPNMICPNCNALLVPVEEASEGTE